MSDSIHAPHPSPNEEYAEFPLPPVEPISAITPSSRQNLEREPTAEAHQYETGLADPLPEPEPEPISQPLADAEPEQPRIRSPRVRFRSISRSISERYHHLHDGSHRVFSDQSDALKHPLLPPPADLTDVPLSGTVTPPAPIHSRHAARTAGRTRHDYPPSILRNVSIMTRMSSAQTLHATASELRASSSARRP